MGKFNLRCTNIGEQLEKLELLFQRVRPGTISAVQSFRLENKSGESPPGVTLTNCRLAVKLITGIVDVTGISAAILARRCQDAQGLEAMDEKWVEVRQHGVGSFQPIGGPYGNGASSANYFAVPDLDPGDTFDIDVRLNVPLGVTTPDVARLRLGLSYQDT